MKKHIEVTVDPTYGKKHLLAGLVPMKPWTCNVMHALLVTGYLSTPPRYRSLSLSTYWAWLRYGAAVSNRTSGLTLRRAWDELDAHQKTILSDDFGMGFPCHFLAEHHGFEDFADTTHLLNTTYKGVLAYKSKAKRGPSKSPDFIATDSSGGLHVLECKGTQSTRKYLEKAVAAGLAQKKNLSSKSGGFFKSCMVGGIFVPQFKSQETAQLLFVDPEPDPRLKELVRMDPSVIRAAIRRQSFAKGLAMCGLWGIATAVDSGGVNSQAANAVRNLEKAELAFNQFRSDGKNWTKTIEYRSADDEAVDGGAFITNLSIQVPESIVEFLKTLVDSKGLLASSRLDEWIEKRTVEQRLTPRSGGPVSDRPDGILQVSVPPANALKFEQSEDDSASVTLPTGLRFTLSLSRVTR